MGFGRPYSATDLGDTKSIEDWYSCIAGERDDDKLLISNALPAPKSKSQARSFLAQRSDELSWVYS